MRDMIALRKFLHRSTVPLRGRVGRVLQLVLGASGLGGIRTIRSHVVSWLGRRYLGLDPTPELGRLRESTPVSRLPLPFGLNVWLVTGHEASKSALGNAAVFSDDFANVTGAAGGLVGHNPGGLGFAARRCTPGCAAC